jgi:acyl carrier protein
MAIEADASTAERKLREAFVNALGTGLEADFASMAYARTPGWDSVAHMALVSEIESAFDVMLSTDDVIGLSSYLKAEEILGRHGIRFA